MEENSTKTLQSSWSFLLEFFALFAASLFWIGAVVHRLYFENPEIYRNRFFLSILVLSGIIASFAFLVQLVLTIVLFANRRRTRFWVASFALFIMLLMIVSAFWIDAPTLLHAT